MKWMVLGGDAVNSSAWKLIGKFSKFFNAEEEISDYEKFFKKT